MNKNIKSVIIFNIYLGVVVCLIIIDIVHTKYAAVVCFENICKLRWSIISATGIRTGYLHDVILQRTNAVKRASAPGIEPRTYILTAMR